MLISNRSEDKATGIILVLLTDHDGRSCCLQVIQLQYLNPSTGGVYKGFSPFPHKHH